MNWTVAPYSQFLSGVPVSASHRRIFWRVWPATIQTNVLTSRTRRGFRYIRHISLPIFPSLATPAKAQAFPMPPPSSPALLRLHRLDRSSPDFDNQLYDILSGQEHVQCEKDLEHGDSVWLIEYLDEVRRRTAIPHSPPMQAQVLDFLDPSSPASRKCLRELRIMCGTRAIIPASYMLPPQLLEISSIPFAYGCSCDVYRGTFDGLEVCIKRFRVYSQDVLQTTASSKVHFGVFPIPGTRNR